MSEKKNILIGSTLSALVLFIRIGVSFCLMPFIIKVLGEHFYGIWILIGTFVGYYGVFDFGINGAIIRFVSREIGANRHDNVKYYVNSAFFALSIFGIAIIIISLFSSFIAPVFVKNADNLKFFRFAVIIMGLSIGTSFPLRVFDGFLSAKMRFDLKRGIELFEIIFRTALTVVLLKMGYGIYGLSIASALSSFLEVLLKVFTSLKIDSSLLFGIRFFSFDKIKEMADFALTNFLSTISSIVTNQLDPYVVVWASNAITVAHYGVALTLTNYYSQFFTTTQGVLFPLFSNKEGANDLKSMERWLLFCSKLSIIISTIFGSMVLLYGRQFIFRWLGASFNSSYAYVSILIIPLIFSFGVFPSIFVLNSTGKHRLSTLLDIIRSSINLILSLVLGYKIGAMGVAVGTAVPCLVFDALLKPYYACRSIKYSYLKYFLILLKDFILICILVIPVWFIFGRKLMADYPSLIVIVCLHFFIIALIMPFILFNLDERRKIIFIIKTKIFKRG